MGKLLNELTNYELNQELEERNLSTEGQKAELQQRLELWLYRNGHNPETFEFKDSFEHLQHMKMDVYRKELKDLINHLDVLREDVKSSTIYLSKKMEDMEQKMNDVTEQLSVKMDGIERKLKNVTCNLNENLSMKMEDMEKKVDNLADFMHSFAEDFVALCGLDASVDSDDEDDLNERSYSDDDLGDERTLSDKDLNFSEDDIVYSDKDADKLVYYEAVIDYDLSEDSDDSEDHDSRYEC